MMYCLECGFSGEPVVCKPGAAAKEAGLWLLLLIPGAVFLIGRTSNRLPESLDALWRQLAHYGPETSLMKWFVCGLFLLPGAFYSIWRRATRYQGCANCRNRRIVPIDSSAAQSALGRLSPTPSSRAWVCDKCGQPIFGGGRFCENCEPSARGARTRAA